jgi:hypothetical protein
MELMKAADLLIEKIKREYKEEVAVVVVMGSHIYNETHSRSDLDMYFVINSPKGYELGLTFVIDGIGFDFWPISWERIERMANHDERVTSIITEGQIIYSGSEADLERFNALKSKALDVSDNKKFTQKSRKVFDQVYKSYFKLEDATDLTSVRRHGINVIFSLTYALALLNKETVKRGRGKLKKEILAMPLVPKDFERHYDVIFESKDLGAIKSASRHLVSNMEELLSNEETKQIEPVEFKEQLHGFYEELINFYNKIHHGCETGDYVTAFYAANEIASEIDDVLTGTGISSSQLPDLVGAFDTNDINKFLEVADEHQKAFVALLENGGVSIRTFKDFDALEAYLNQLGKGE